MIRRFFILFMIIMTAFNESYCLAEAENACLQQPGSREFVCMWWPEGLKKRDCLLFESGWYAAAWNIYDLSLTRLCGIPARDSRTAALDGYDVVFGLPQTRSEILCGGEPLVGDGSTTVTYYGSCFNKVETGTVKTGRGSAYSVSISATPVAMILNIVQTMGEEEEIAFTQTFPDSYKEVDSVRKPLSIAFADGAGRTVHIVFENGAIRAEGNAVTVYARGSVTVVFLPSESESSDDAAKWEAAKNVSVNYSFLFPDGEASAQNKLRIVRRREIGCWKLLPRPM